MIPRYSRNIITNIWSQESKYKIWLDIEIYAAEAMEKYKIIPKGVAKKVRKKLKINVKRIDDIEKITKHDVIAFLTSIAEKVGPEAKFLHQGMTSSDVLDTCFNIQLQKAGIILLEDLNQILKTLKQKAHKHKNTICMGRSHGIHAEPITFGLKLATYYEEFKRNKKRLESAIKEISTCAISGAVGTFAHLSPKVEQYVAKKLKLTAEPISTQIIPRDRHAQIFSTLGIIASSAERLATEIRHLQRTEVYEAEEFFAKGQKGSSAMPHKRNPILTENITGLARMIRAYANPAMENVALWHERDISHSSNERFWLPDAFITTDFMLHRMNSVIANLTVMPENMMKNLNLTGGLVFSQRVLLELPKAGVSREDAYRIVQRNAMKVWDEIKQGKPTVNEDGESLYLGHLLGDDELRAKLSEEQIRECFNYDYYTKNVDKIYNRVFNK